MKRARPRKSGQVILVLVFLLVGLVFLFLAEIDIFAAARGKTRLQNAGDAAALAAAAWQGTTLNLVGELNLLRLAAACETNLEAVAGIYALQERLAVAGPCIALLAANETARENLEPHLPNDTVHLPAYRELAAMGDIVQSFALAASGRGDGDADGSWPTKNADYADMLRAALSGGSWVGADNAQILPSVVLTGGHPLYSRAFYDAADAGNWPRICLNVFGGRHGEAVSTLLNWPGWGTVPEATTIFDWDNPEFFGVHFRRAAAPEVISNAAVDRILGLATELGLDPSVINADNVRKFDAFHFGNLPWFFLDGVAWRDWHELDPGGVARFPVRSRVRDEYNVKGAAAACRVLNVLVPVSDATHTNLFAWTACARPFGSWHGEKANAFPLTGTGAVSAEGSPDLSLAMPVFRMARLIPLGGVGESHLGAADPSWLGHVRNHVPNGFRAAGCRFCAILKKWDDPSYTRAGGRYLMDHDHDDVCAPPIHGGNAPGGGTRHAH